MTTQHFPNFAYLAHHDPRLVGLGTQAEEGRIGNAAVHEGRGEAREALHQIQMARELAVWFQRSFGNNRVSPLTDRRSPVRWRTL